MIYEGAGARAPPTSTAASSICSDAIEHQTNACYRLHATKHFEMNASVFCRKNEAESIVLCA